MVAFHLRSLALATAVVILAAALLAGMVTKHNFPQEVTFRTGHYNKNNSCVLPFVHNDDNEEKRIHACALCYFVMGGMINVHRLIQCPLLAT